MKILRIASLCLLFVAPMISYAQSDPQPVAEQDKFFRPILVVPPEFPQLASTQKLPVEIRVKGIVSEDGKLESPEFSPVEGNEKFIEAIKEVLPLWRFRPAVDHALCAPVASNGVVQVWFEVKEGSPTVSVSFPKNNVISPSTAAKAPVVVRTLARRPKIEFPFAAHVAGMEGSTNLLLMVNHDGEIVQKRVLYSIPDKAFGDAGLIGVRRALFNVIKPDADTPKTICMSLPINYCLSNGATYRSNTCK